MTGGSADLAPFVRIVARGQGRARPLTQDEAQEAMTLILGGKAAPEALGALLMVLRLRGEADTEIAGFTAAMRAQAPVPETEFDLDWPCYAAGRTRGAPLFLLAAALVAQAGFRVALHGWNSHQGTGACPRTALEALDLCGPDLVYFPLETLSPVGFELLRLRDTFGLRSCINTVLRMWNPMAARACVQGVFHPSYRGLQTRAAELLGDQDLTVIKGGGGEFERHPGKAAMMFGLRGGRAFEASAPAVSQAVRKVNDAAYPVDIVRLWRGESEDEFARQVVTSTAAVALWTLRAAPDTDAAFDQAETLWAQRHSARHQTDKRIFA